MFGIFNKATKFARGICGGCGLFLILSTQSWSADRSAELVKAGTAFYAMGQIYAGAESFERAIDLTKDRAARAALRMAWAKAILKTPHLAEGMPYRYGAKLLEHALSVLGWIQYPNPMHLDAILLEARLRYASIKNNVALEPDGFPDTALSMLDYADSLYPNDNRALKLSAQILHEMTEVWFYYLQYHRKILPNLVKCRLTDNVSSVTTAIGRDRWFVRRYSMMGLAVVAKLNDRFPNGPRFSREKATFLWALGFNAEAIGGLRDEAKSEKDGKVRKELAAMADRIADDKGPWDGLVRASKNCFGKKQPDGKK